MRRLAICYKGLVEYKFVELQVVTDESLTESVNKNVADGWQLENIHFVRNEGSRRPQMAFIAFVKESPAQE